MEEFWRENIKLHFQRSVPFISAAVFILIFNIPLYPFVADSIRPSISIICIYFWLINRPYLFGILSVYFLGLLEDVVSSLPFGTSIFTTLLAYVLTNTIYKFVLNKPFIVVLYGFAFVAFITMMAKWFVVSVYYSQFLPLFPLIFSILTSIAFYPIFSFINFHIHEFFMQDDGD